MIYVDKIKLNNLKYHLNLARYFKVNSPVIINPEPNARMEITNKELYCNNTKSLEKTKLTRGYANKQIIMPAIIKPLPFFIFTFAPFLDRYSVHIF